MSFVAGISDPSTLHGIVFYSLLVHCSAVHSIVESYDVLLRRCRVSPFLITARMIRIV